MKQKAFIGKKKVAAPLPRPTTVSTLTSKDNILAQGALILNWTKGCD